MLNAKTLDKCTDDSDKLPYTLLFGGPLCSGSARHAADQWPLINRRGAFHAAYSTTKNAIAYIQSFMWLLSWARSLP